MNPGELERLLTLLDQWDGSDLHLKAGAPPRMRINGRAADAGRRAAAHPRRHRGDRGRDRAARVAEAFHRHHEVDFAYSIPGLARFRVNAFYQRSTVATGVPTRPVGSMRPAEELGLPEVVYELASEQRGLVLVTGPTGSREDDHASRRWSTTSTGPGPATSSPSRTRSSTSTATSSRRSSSERWASTPTPLPPRCGWCSARTPT